MADNSRGGHGSHHRGGRGGGNFRGRVGGGHRGNERGGRGGGHHNQHQSGETTTERPKKENILDLSKYSDKEIRVKFAGGREGTFSLIATHTQTQRERFV